MEARVNTHLSDIIEWPEIEILNQLIPYKLSDKEMEKQLAVQVKYFSCGGIIIGICISHRISDGSTLISFIKGWAALPTGKAIWCGVPKLYYILFLSTASPSIGTDMEVCYCSKRLYF